MVVLGTAQRAGRRMKREMRTPDFSCSNSDKSLGELEGTRAATIGYSCSAKHKSANRMRCRRRLRGAGCALETSQGATGWPRWMCLVHKSTTGTRYARCGLSSAYWSELGTEIAVASVEVAGTTRVRLRFDRVFGAFRLRSLAGGSSDCPIRI